MARHVAHLAVETGKQPVAEPRFIGRKLDPGNAQSRKAEFAAPAFDVRNQTGRIGGPVDGVVAMHRVRIMRDNVFEPQMELQLSDAGATEALGAALARARPSSLGGCRVLYLRGELGAGKTTCVRSLLRTLGVEGLIRSPTYTLVETYEARGYTCIHVDLYRLLGPVEVDELGLRDYLDTACLLLVEWPEKGGRALPAPDLELTLTYSGNSRHACLQARTASGRDWLNLLAHDTSLTSYVSNLT